MQREIALDTNAWGTLCATIEAPAQTLIEATDAKEAKLVFLPEVLMESFVGGTAHSRRRTEVLAEIESLRPSSRIAITLDKLWKRERSGSWRSGTPVYANVRMSSFAKTPEDFDRIHSENAPELRGDIESERELMSRLERQAKQGYEDTTTAQERKQSDALLKDFSNERVLCRKWLSKILGITPEEAAAFLSDPEKVRHHRSHMLACGLAATNGISALLYDRRPPGKDWIKRDPGNWADARIAANAAYTDYLVTDDRSLYGRLEFLRESGFIAPAPMRLADLLNADNSQP